MPVPKTETGYLFQTATSLTELCLFTDLKNVYKYNHYVMSQNMLEN